MARMAGGQMVRRIVLVATEESGDRLGARLMKVLRQRLGDAVEFSGVGGRDMAREGLTSLFPIEELSIVGFSAVIRHLPKILRLIRRTADTIVASAPDVLVIIDSPDFTQRVARRVRARDGTIPIVNYVAPTVWAWRPGRARAMRRYVDQVAALLPFEPAAYQRLGGPPCTYVGHPLIEQIGSLRPNAEEQARRDGTPPLLLVLPGSRRSEVARHLAIFGETLDRLRGQNIAFEAVLPITPHLEEAVKAGIASWPMAPRIVLNEADKRAVFRRARAALAKSGTVTLELAISGVPMVTAYRVGELEAFILRRVIRVQSVILANLVIGDNVIPEYLQEACTPDNLAPALADVLADSPGRQRQRDAFAKLDTIMSTGAASPSVQAAEIVLETMRKGRRAV